MGAVVAAVASVADLRGAIGFSSFAVLAYYAVANASAWTLGTGRVVPTVGLLGCVLLAFSLPTTSVLAGVLVLAVGAVVYGVRRAGHQGTHGAPDNAGSG